jgi:hypothetical protein
VAAAEQRRQNGEVDQRVGDQQERVLCFRHLIMRLAFKPA